MQAVLISINKPNTDNIFSGIKSLEWRKRPLPEGLCYVYETKNKGGCGKVIGEMHVIGSRPVDTSRPLEVCLVNAGCVHPVALKRYANNGTVYANFIKDAKRYDTPRSLSNFLRCNYPWDCCACDYFDGLDMSCNKPKRPPQSWCYVEEVQPDA